MVAAKLVLYHIEDMMQSDAMMQSAQLPLSCRILQYVDIKME